jgi:glutathione synthase/RimK-type ligase-like ATP-grasp enzyme
MSKLIIVVDNVQDWKNYYPSEDLITVQDYLARSGTYDASRTQVINLCRSYRYLSHGYYCSLLAEARDHKVLPSVRTINDLRNKSIYSLDIEDLNENLHKVLARTGQAGNSFTLKLFFGQTDYEPLEDLARQLFEQYACPILVVEFTRDNANAWLIESIKAGALNNLTDTEEDRFAEALNNFSRKIWRKPRSRKKYRYDMAILVNREEKLPPSDPGALANFIRVGRMLGIDVELIGKKDFARLAEYDALFIRETTAINNHTYRFAKKAESEGMVVIDDPESILKCTNKVYLADLLKENGVPAPRTEIISKNRESDLDALAQTLGFPLVLKIPDGSFSRGIVKVNSPAELQTHAEQLFRQSSLLLAQEFFYTEYDWRIGIINQKPIYACQYHMARGHWQIYSHQESGKTVSGGFTTFPVRDAPPAVVKAAVKAANLIGNGLYGVDVKQGDNKVAVIEVNDNPNIDSDVEDAYLGEDLYRIILEEFIRRLERKRLGL